MRKSAQCEVGSRLWLEAKCREGDCQGQFSDSHGDRIARIQRLYPVSSYPESLKHAFANECGPACTKLNS